ncbi:MAG: DNA repair protein RadC [Lachnospiraceae bacterium]|nr:DNA repair protein RadC [Lachnospiraceae bacterium]
MKKEHMKDLPIAQQPYEVCWNYGASALTDAQLLSIIMKNGTKDVNVLELSGSLLGEEGNLLSLINTSRNGLLKLKGIGRVKAMQIECIVELAKRISVLNITKGVQIKDASMLMEYFGAKLKFLKKEHLFAVFLDTKCHFKKEVLLSVGTVNASIISPREIFIEALKEEAVYVILVHNHPSGDVTPSKADMEVTGVVKEIGDLLEIPLLDHIIIGDNSYFSMKEYKLL